VCDSFVNVTRSFATETIVPVVETRNGRRLQVAHNPWVPARAIMAPQSGKATSISLITYLIVMEGRRGPAINRRVPDGRLPPALHLLLLGETHRRGVKRPAWGVASARTRA
jgi:hypothetical protein